MQGSIWFGHQPPLPRSPLLPHLLLGVKHLGQALVIDLGARAVWFCIRLIPGHLIPGWMGEDADSAGYGALEESQHKAGDVGSLLSTRR